MAVGATPGNVLGLIFRQGFITVGTGVVVGAAAAVASRLLTSMLAGMQATDPTAMCIAGALVTTTGAVACWIPAQRATRTDPMAALRQE